MRKLLAAFALFFLPCFTRAATIPFVGCSIDSDAGQVTPAGQPITVNMPDDVATKLALYVGVNNLGVLAPRGWKCSGGQAVAGNSISISPSADSGNEAGIITASTVVYDLGGTGGEVGKYALYFPKIISMHDAITDAAGWDQPVSQYIIKKYRTDDLRYLGDSTFEFATPANGLGLGDVLLPVGGHAPEPAPLATDGVISINFEDGTMLQSFVMQLPQNLSYLHPYITDFVASCFLDKSSCAINGDQ